MVPRLPVVVGPTVAVVIRNSSQRAEVMTSQLSGGNSLQLVDSYKAAWRVF